jgi:hypothetical protein
MLTHPCHGRRAPATHDLRATTKVVGGRAKPGHDTSADVFAGGCDTIQDANVAREACAIEVERSIRITEL